MGLYIVSSKKDSLLTFNLSPSTMEYLLDASIDTLEGGDPVKINHIPVDFNYRKAVNKIETACVYPAMSAPDKLLQSTQIIILTIDKK
jgi:hypothetical protein